MLPSRGWSERTVRIVCQIPKLRRALEEEAAHVEWLIRYDLSFDGYWVTLTRLDVEKPDTLAWRARVRPRI